MQRSAKLEASLTLAPRKEALPLAQSFAESSALAGGLEPKQALALALAAEELFIHICGLLDSGSELRISSVCRTHCVELRFAFRGAAFDMRAFNMTAKPSGDHSDEALVETGLLLAARSVDSFSLSEEPGGLLELRLVKDKVYPAQERPFLAPPPSTEASSLRTRDAVDEEFSVLAAGLIACGFNAVPSFLLSPGKAADMRMAGELAASVSVRPDGMICGAIAWRQLESRRAVECFGPYPFVSDPVAAGSIAKSLLDDFLSKICKGDETIVIARGFQPSLAEGYFEPVAAEGRAFFRQLKEDSGSTLWVVPEIEGFVEEACSRLYLPRNVVQAQSPLGRVEPHSVVFAELDRGRLSAALRPVRYGLDVEANVRSHVKALKAEGFASVLAELDLGAPSHCLFSKAFLDAGFKPVGLLPSAATGDLLVLELAGG